MTDLDLIFRSIINFKNTAGEPTIPQQDLLRNFRALQEVIPSEPEDKSYHSLYGFLYNFVKECSGAAPELPSYEFVKNYFENIEGNEAVLALIEKIKGQQPYVGQDFRRVLKMYNDEQNVLKLERVLSNVNKIATSGMDVGTGRNKQKYKGVMDAINYFAVETKEIQRQVTGIKLESQIVSQEDVAENLMEYEKVKRDPLDAIGITTGLTHIDKHLKGLKNTELMLVAAAPGHCKTTFSINMAYRALYGGWNTAFVTLEMNLSEIRRAIYVLHSCNQRRFRKLCPEYSDLIGTLKYNDVLYGTLTDQESEYYKEVLKDIEGTEEYGRLSVWQPDETLTTVSDIDFKLRQIQQEYQAANRGDLEFVVIDYISLLGLDRESKTKDYNQDLNNIIKQLKRLCLTFNNGKGLRILSPFQMNREGFREAQKNDGIYSHTALSNAHEAERSSDVVISLFLGDDDRRNGMLKICNLKARRDKPFDPFQACVNFDSKYIYDFAGDYETDPLKNMEIILGTK